MKATMLVEMAEEMEINGFVFRKGAAYDMEVDAARFLMSQGKVQPASAAERYKKAFGNEPRSLGKFFDLLKTEAADELIGLCYPDGICRKAALTSQGGGLGGYLIPPDFAEQLLAAGEPGLIRPRATLIPSQTEEKLVPLVDVTTVQAAGTSNFFGGLSLTWNAEGFSFTQSNPAFKLLALKLSFLGGVVYLSNALWYDTAPKMRAAILTALFGRAIGWYEEYAFFQGTGVGQPMGLLNAPATIAVMRLNADLIGYADVATMLEKLLPESFSRAIWAFAPTALPQLLQLKDGSERAVFLQAGVDANGRGQFSLLGIPAYSTDKLPALGTKGDLMLIDPSFYVISDFVNQSELVPGPAEGLASGLAIAVSPHVKFLTNQTAVMIAKRVDGQPWPDKAITLQDGSTQVSPFVALQ